MRAIPRLLALSAVLVALAATSGCGEKSEPSEGQPDELTLALDWFPNPDHTGIYQALEGGYFAEAGLDVKPQVPSDPSAPIKQVAAGRVDLAISYEPEVLLAREQGLDVVAVAALVREPLTSLVSLRRADIRRPRDLKGKRVATAGIPYQTAYLEAILREVRLSPEGVRQVDVGLNLLPALLSGRVDAALGLFWNIEGVQLRERGRSARIRPVDELGIPTYDELVLVASEQRIADDPESIRLFIASVDRATRDARRNPNAAIRALLQANEDLDPKLTRAQVKATLPVLAGEPGRPYGFMKLREWEEFARFLADNGLIDELPEPDEMLTNELLPGRIPD